MLLGKPKLDTIEFLISKTLIDSYTGHEELVLANNVLKKSSNWKNFWGTIYKNNGNLLCQL